MGAAVGYGSHYGWALAAAEFAAVLILATSSGLLASETWLTPAVPASCLFVAERRCGLRRPVIR
jgi:hypothetical protein